MRIESESFHPLPILSRSNGVGYSLSDRRLIIPTTGVLPVARSKSVVSSLQNYNYLYSYIWANDDNARRAIHVREVKKKKNYLFIPE